MEALLVDTWVRTEHLRNCKSDSTGQDEWSQNCPYCAARKRPTQKHRGPLQNIRCGYPMQMVAADIFGPLHRNSQGNRYILAVSNYFT